MFAQLKAAAEAKARAAEAKAAEERAAAAAAGAGASGDSKTPEERKAEEDARAEAARVEAARAEAKKAEDKRRAEEKKAEEDRVAAAAKEAERTALQQRWQSILEAANWDSWLVAYIFNKVTASNQAMKLALMRQIRIPTSLQQVHGIIPGEEAEEKQREFGLVEGVQPNAIVVLATTSPMWRPMRYRRQYVASVTRQGPDAETTVTEEVRGEDEVDESQTLRTFIHEVTAAVNQSLAETARASGAAAAAAAAAAASTTNTGTMQLKANLYQFGSWSGTVYNFTNLRFTMAPNVIQLNLAGGMGAPPLCVIKVRDWIVVSSHDDASKLIPALLAMPEPTL